jgi:hypothetical protein
MTPTLNETKPYIKSLPYIQLNFVLERASSLFKFYKIKNIGLDASNVMLQLSIIFEK